MNDVFFTTLGEVAQISIENYERYQKRSDFPDVLKQLLNTGNVSTVPSRFHRIENFLSAEEFRTHAYTSPVSIRPILTQYDPFYVDEVNMFPTQKDVFTLIHLPYNKSDMHVHDFFEINYIYRGSCLQIFSDEKKEFQQGDLVMIAPHSPHCVYVDEESFIVCICIRQSTFNQTFLQLLNTNTILSAFFKHSLYDKDARNYMTLRIKEPETYEPLIQQIYSESNLTDEYSNSVCISLVNIFFAKMLRQFGNNIQMWDSDRTAGFNNEFPMIMRFVAHNYSTVSLPMLSEIFHYSEVHISRMFKQNLNQNFSCIIRNLKLSNAKNYLENTNYTIEEISGMVGYDSSDYLSRAFKKQYDMTPSDYRKMIRTHLSKEAKKED